MTNQDSEDAFRLRLTRTLRLAAIVLVIKGAAAPLHAQTRGVTAEDYFAFETPGDPRVSPDGAAIVFTITTVDQKQNRRHTDLWLVPADLAARPPGAPTGGPAAVKLTTSAQSSTSPRWSPNGKSIAFLSARTVPGDADGPAAAPVAAI